jgi:hypothetical protein
MYEIKHTNSQIICNLMESVDPEDKVYNIYDVTEENASLISTLREWQARGLGLQPVKFSCDEFMETKRHLDKGVVMCLPQDDHGLSTSLIWKAYKDMAPDSTLLAVVSPAFLTDNSNVGTAFRTWVLHNDTWWRLVYAEDIKQVVVLVRMVKSHTEKG